MTPADFTIHWPYLALATLMLWFPRQWLRLGGRLFKRRHKHRDKLEQFATEEARDPEDKSVRLGKELVNKRNWLDLFRAAAGSFSLTLFSFELTVRSSEARLTVLGLQVLVCLVGLLIQCIRREEKVSYFAPIFYLIGMSAGLPDEYYPALFALLLVMAINPAIPNPRVFLAAFALLLLPFGFLFGANLTRLIATSVLVCLPSLISLLAGRPLVIYSKRVKPA